MKTFEQIRNEVISEISVSEIMGVRKLSFADVESLAAKEYAKQWIERAAQMENENAKLKNDLDILNESLKNHKAVSEKLRDIYLKKCKEGEPSNECPYCAPDGTIWNGDGSKICPHCKGSHYLTT